MYRLKGMDQYQKVKTIHDYICKQVTYVNDGSKPVHTAAPAFIWDKGVVCEGYAKSMKIFCDAMGIDCACVCGLAKLHVCRKWCGSYVELYPDGGFMLVHGGCHMA
ncbi:MAG: transglutaminase-like domain-containing protein [Blautia sp.]